MNPDRAFLFGLIAGILIIIGTFTAVCEIAGVRWQPVFINRT